MQPMHQLRYRICLHACWLHARSRALAPPPPPLAIPPPRWALGCTLFEIFCGPIRSPADLKNIQSMPEALRPDYMRLLSSNPAGRLRPIEMLQNPLFDEEYVSLQLFLETLNVKDAVEKVRSARQPYPLTPEPSALTRDPHPSPLTLKPSTPEPDPSPLS